MSDYTKEKWVQLYSDALGAIKHATMLGCIGDARRGIIERIDALKTIPGIHAAEYLAIEDAIRALQVLECEEDRSTKTSDAKP